MLNKSLPTLSLIIGVISVSTSAIFVKLSSADAGTIAFYRLLFSTILLLPYFLFKSKSDLNHFNRKDWWLSLLSGLFLAVHFILWFESLNYTSVASSTVLVTLQPIFAFIGTYIFFKEVISIKSIIAASIAIVGSFIISWGDFKVDGQALLGDMLALAACALVTGYLLIGQSLRKKLTLTSYTFIVYGFSSVILLIYVLLNGEMLVGFSNDNWIYFLLLAIFPTLLGHSLFNWSIKYISTNVISVAILLEPVGATILAYLLLNESIYIYQIVGGMIIIVGILLFSIPVRLVIKKKRSIENHS
ncbi:membrane protein [Bacillus coahuilensis p1.1.43]|uniref:Membrane protein n=1 Tax=Bacillus coahuilensis p1.1.43 TaxID=1150625 RepID=A0A147K6G6_9BACI|nr:membrane protein [Bacillus coahuilensis p1.1.43]